MNLTDNNRNVNLESAEKLKECVLAMYDIRGKQNFIYRSTHLKEIAGGSAIIRDCFDDFLYPAAETVTGTGCTGKSKGIMHAEKGMMQEDFTLKGVYRHLFEDGYIGEVVYEGGGNYLLIFKNEDIFKEVTYRFTKALMFGTSMLRKYGRNVPKEKDVPGTQSLKVLGTCIGNLNFEDYEYDRTRLYRKHQRSEASESINIPSGTLPIVQVSYDTSMPLTHRRPDIKNSVEKITAESYAKYFKYKQEVKSHRSDIWKEVLNEDEDCGGIAGPKVLDKIVTKKGEDSLLAVIFIDGNGMGAKVQERTENLKNYEECVKALRAFSAEIQQIYITDPIQRIDAYLELKYRDKKPNNGKDSAQNKIGHQKRRIVVSAGDEISFVCNAHDAYDIMRVYLEGLPEKHSSCAGAAIFHSHAPYNEAYRIAEECCENCKKYMRKNELSEACFMDFHYCQSGIGISLEMIRKHESGSCISKPWLVIPKWKDKKAKENSVDLTIAPSAEDNDGCGKSHVDTQGEDKTTLYGHEDEKLIAKMAKFLNDIGRSNKKGLAESAKDGSTQLELDLYRIKSHMDSEKKKVTDFSFVEGIDPTIKAPLFYDMAIMHDLWFMSDTDGGRN